jgi:hypothetical protein
VCRADAMFMNATSFNQPIEAFLGHLNLHTSTYRLFANNAFDEEKEVALRRYRQDMGRARWKTGMRGEPEARTRKRKRKGEGPRTRTRKPPSASFNEIVKICEKTCGDCERHGVPVH